MLFILLMIGRRFGWKGKIASVVLLGLYQAVRERIWFGDFIPALNYRPGILPVLGSAAMIVGAGLTGLIVMRLTGRPDAVIRDRE
jgi:hypothetical protein